MTMWIPDLSGATGPKYRSLANAIGEAISAGELAPGDRLPTHRDLAWRLGVTVGTVSRAYAIAQSQGWITGQVGRGTYVSTVQNAPAWPESGRREVPAQSDRATTDHFSLAQSADRSPIRMNQSFSSSPDVMDMLAEAMRRVAAPARLAGIDGYLPSNGLVHHRAAGMAWLRQFGVEGNEDSILIVNGCQHGLIVSFMALTGPGDTVLLEALTWPGASQLLMQLGRRAVSVDIDEYGIIPDAFEAACRKSNPRVLYTVPTIHNPTTAVMPEDRRRAIASIAIEHDVYIVEDGVFGFIVEDAPPPIARFAPEKALYVTSLSKAVAPILRTGYVCAPPTMVPRIAAAIRATTLMPPGLAAELATDLIESGGAARAAGWQREEAALRQRMVGEILGDVPRQAHGSATHFWLTLPDRWNAASFTAAALARGVAIAAGDAFASDTGSSVGDQSVRVCLCAESDRNRIRDGLEILASLLREAPPTEESVI